MPKSACLSRILLFLLSGLLALAGVVAQATENPPTRASFSAMTARLVQGPRTTEYVYARRETAETAQLLIRERGKALPPPPYNLIDLGSGAVTILYPQNSTYEVVETAVPPDSAGSALPFPGMPPLPPGLGPRIVPGAVGAASSWSSTPQRDFFPEMPPLPDFGAEVEATVVSQASIFPSPPSHPSFPALMAFQTGREELRKTDERREILGYPCTLYEWPDRRHGVLKVWATTDLGPFHFLLRSPPKANRRTRSLSAWPARSRDLDVFPLLVILSKGEQEVYRFEVTSLEEDLPAAPLEAFEIPASFHPLRGTAR
jgi:hypothetical protein